MSALAIPRPAPGLDPFTVCQQIEAQMGAVIDVAALHDAKARLSAIDEYLAQTSKDGRAQIAATMRRLEVRIGQVVGAAEQTWTGKPSTSAAAEVLDKDERYEFRQMAEHGDVVEKVIAESTDAEPASRNKVLTAIREKKSQNMSDVAAPSNTREAVRRRVDNIRHYAERGNSSRQIAELVGISVKGVKNICAREGIEVPADLVLGRSVAIDIERIVEETINALDGIVMGLSMIEAGTVLALDTEKRRDWSEAIAPSLAALKTFKKELDS